MFQKALVEKKQAHEESHLSALLSADTARLLNKKHHRGWRSMNPVRASQLIRRFVCLTHRRCDDSTIKRQKRASELMMRTVQPLQEQAFRKSQAAAVAAALPLEDLPTDAVGISAM